MTQRSCHLVWWRPRPRSVADANRIVRAAKARLVPSHVVAAMREAVAADPRIARDDEMNRVLEAKPDQLLSLSIALTDLPDVLPALQELCQAHSVVLFDFGSQELLGSTAPVPAGAPGRGHRARVRQLAKAMQLGGPEILGLDLPFGMVSISDVHVPVAHVPIPPPRLIDYMLPPDPTVRRPSARSLAKCLRDLGGRQTGPRVLAAQRLGSFPGAEAVGALDAAATTDRSALVRLQALVSLAVAGTDVFDRAVAELVSLHPGAVEPYPRRLGPPDPEERQAELRRLLLLAAYAATLCVIAGDLTDRRERLARAIDGQAARDDVFGQEGHRLLLSLSD